ncbi:1-acyl-sn-glycerol-3-phosphate acyltransferase [Hahella sp. CCB-MM4]|uniref:lysophospholipid acyltransferase family protein n=1 Tax=Hahella sp. (strain CCB-MM4) TaxID=1926491 RepID=UPI000BD0CCB5|nr:lysophospholipid acyltransferase family protein [Hahella sp. CCB-MM4]OZG70659.1 1-acyl-sn-glycerol-3-phosphate acyltransferase [Hahella sp. CCB-MM4]
MEYLRLICRSILLIPYLFWGFTLAVFISTLNRIRHQPINTTPIARWWLSGLCRVLSVDIQQYGELEASSTMIIANHISWLDIPVLGAMKPLHFLSKAEVREWPLIGFLAEQAGTLFIKRGGGQVAKVQEEIEDILSQEKTVLIFPEGTTTDGQTVKKFHPRLFKAAQATCRNVQPVTLHYRREGTPDSLAPFIGDDEFFSHLIRLLKAPPTEVYVVAHPALGVTAGTDVTELSRDAHRRIEHTLQHMVWQNQPRVITEVSGESITLF